MKATAVLSLLVALVCCRAVLGQVSVKSQDRPPPAQLPAKNPEQNRIQEIEQAAIQREAIERVSRYVTRAAEFKGLEARTLTVIRIADVLWDLDPDSARKEFLRVYDSLKAVLPSEQDKSAESRELGLQLARLSSSLISLLARHDTALAGKLKPLGSPSDGNAFVRMGQINNAMRLLGAENNLTKAVDTVEAALGAELGREVSSLMLFLQELRAKDAAAANRLFMGALQRLRTQRLIDPETLMLLGTYLFGDPRLIGSEEARTTVRRVQIDNLLVVNLAADRPGIPEELVGAYLAVAVEVLYNAEPEPRKRPSYYVLAYQLYARVERISPNLIPMLQQAMAYLLQDVPQTLTEALARTSMSTPTSESELDVAGTIKHVEQILGTRLRDEAYLKIASSLFHKGNLSGARQIVARIDDLGVKARITNLIGSAEAINAVTEGNLLDAEALASKLMPRVETALVWLEIAHARIKKDYKPLGREAIDASVAMSASLDPEAQPLILLMASSELARVDSQGALSMLNDAARLLDTDKTTRGSWAKLWRQTIDVGRTSRSFLVQRRGLPADWGSCIRELSKVDSQQAESAALTVKCEDVAGDFLVVMASEAINGARQAQQKLKSKPEFQTDRKTPG
jgi:hypothetical protein